MSSKAIKLTETEMELMEVIWRLNGATARQVLEEIPKKNYAYSTVITLLQRMELKGALNSRKGNFGKAFIFEPAIKPEQVHKQVVKSLLQNYFQNDPIAVFTTLCDAKKLKKDEIQQIRSMLDDMEKS